MAQPPRMQPPRMVVTVCQEAPGPSPSVISAIHASTDFGLLRCISSPRQKSEPADIGAPLAESFTAVSSDESATRRILSGEEGTWRRSTPDRRPGPRSAWTGSPDAHPNSRCARERRDWRDPGPPPPTSAPRQPLQERDRMGQLVGLARRQDEGHGAPKPVGYHASFGPIAPTRPAQGFTGVPLRL